MSAPADHLNAAPTLPRLTRAWLNRPGAMPPVGACGPIKEFPERIIQFGEGNFLRAFTDWMFDALNEHGLLGSSVVVVPPTRRGRPDALNAQDGLYTVLLRGLENGRQFEHRRIITSVSRAVSAYEAWDELVRTFCQPEMRIVVSNTTEAGINFLAEPHQPGTCPESFPAKVAALLHHRFIARHGDAAAGLIFLPCELIERNGATLRDLVLRHAEIWNLGRPFADWVTRCNYFLNTLVDRIVPGYPHSEAPQLNRDLGYEDSLIVAAEWFHLWVIEGPPHLADELPFHRAGLNVIWTNDLAPYRTRKVRILNGAHTTSALAAFLGGLDTVGEMMRDATFGGFLRRAIFDEILPSVPGEEPERTTYANAVMERFENPFTRHELLSIALNSVSKWRVRVLPSLLDYVATRSLPPPLLSFSLAALLTFYRGQRTPTGELLGQRGEVNYPIRDDQPVLSFFEGAWRDFEQHHQPRLIATAALGEASFWGCNLNAVPGLTNCVSASLSSILHDGVRTAANRLLS